MTKDELEKELAAVRAERDAYKRAAHLLIPLAADDVLRLKTGMSYAQASARYEEAIRACPDQRPYFGKVTNE